VKPAVPRLDVPTKRVQGVLAHGARVDGPPMLRPNEIDRAISAGRRHVLQAPPPRAPAAPGRAVPKMPGTGTPGARRAMALPSDSSASGTGINPWWRYHEENVPGGGHVMVNVGTGNLVIQDDDMSVPHKGMALAFRRTYNSQSSATSTPNNYGSWQSLFGNGWTNTFDAHLVSISSSQLAIYDIDGARYDYAIPAGTQFTNGTTLPPMTAGQHATLTFDGSCGWLWTKKSGTSYYFYSLNPSLYCPALNGPVAGYSGRLHQIIGRNRNTYLTFSYAWDNGDASVNGKISQITATTESGMIATLSFADFSGRRLLQQLTYPDGATYVAYGYDVSGNLNMVSRPPNNSSGIRPVQWFGAQTIGSDSIINGAASPRYSAGCNVGACGSDGAVLYFGFTGSSASSSLLSSITHTANVNSTVADGTASPLQAGYRTDVYAYLTEYFTTGVTTPTLRDTDGHMTNWVVDGSGRPTQTQECTVSLSQGQQCIDNAHWLIKAESWDANNNLISVTDPAGNRTDAAYDAAGNVVAIAQPSPSQGAARPTILIDYDAFGNVLGICTPVETPPSGAWAGQYTAGSDSYCSSLLGTANHAQYGYTYPSYEPYGEPTSETSPSGYTRTVAYDAAAQGGADYGLATRRYGPQITQFDQTPRTPSSSAAYDSNGNVVCARADSSSSAASIMTYDSMNRVLASADPDDASLTSGACAKSAGLPGSAIVSTNTYYPDGSLATSQSPSQAAASFCSGGCLTAGTLYTYDLDGNPIAEAPYHSSPASPLTPTMRRWFDGAGRLIETAEPSDPNTSGDIAILIRYIYDLSQSGTATTRSGAGVTAHGNVFNVQKNTPTGWTDFTYSAFDAANRVTNAYAFAPCPYVSGASGPIYCSQGAFVTRYDWDSSPLTSITAPGLLVASLDGLGQSKVYTYDGEQNETSVSYGGDGGVTPNTTYAYDANSRISTSSNAANTVQYTYAADGQISVIQSSSLSGTTSYNYYSDGVLSGVSSVASPYVNVPNLYQYSYRNDGFLAAESFGKTGQSVAYTYTAGGRPTAQTDFSSSPSLTQTYDVHGRIATYTTPAGSYNSLTYDPEGRMLQYSAFNGETATSQYNIRGELIARTFQPNSTVVNAYGAMPAFQYRSVQGVLVQNSSDQYDGRTGAPLVLAGNSAAVSMTYDAIGRMVRTNLASYAYDAENRIISGDLKTVATAGDPNCSTGGAAIPSGGSTELSYSYDSTGQLGQDVFSSSGRQYTRRWSWDRGNPIFTLSSTGSSNPTAAFQADGLGYTNTGFQAPGLTLTDRDFDGFVAIHHNRTGNSAWWASNAYHQECISSEPVAASANYVDPGNSVPAETDGGSSQALSVDSSGRATLSRANGFTTPDYSSGTPYSTSSARTVLSLSGRPDRVDKSCDSGKRYADGNKECEPVSDIGFVGSKRGPIFPPGGPNSQQVMSKGPRTAGAMAKRSVPFLCKVGPSIWGLLNAISFDMSGPVDSAMGPRDPSEKMVSRFNQGLNGHPSGKDVADAGAVAVAVGAPVEKYAPHPAAKALGGGMVVGGGIMIAGGQLSDNRCPPYP
jgi:YD repeat-containing protein